MDLTMEKYILILLIFFVIIGVIIFFIKGFIKNYIIRLNIDTIEAPGKAGKVIVFAPHNDDEVLGAGGFIKRTLENGGKVKVVLMTNGDGFKAAVQFDCLNFKPNPKDYIKFAYQRQKESISALEKLGLLENDIVFLGYPDGGMRALWEKYWNKTKSYTSKSTQSNKTPYNNSFTRVSSYCGESVVSDISKIIEEYRPIELVYPHPNDRHPDHWTTDAFIKYTLAILNYKPKKELLYLVHRGDWPTQMKREPNMYLVPPLKLIGTGTKWYAFDLNSDDISEKTKAIHTYRTQIKILKPLLTTFERKNELFGRYDNLKIPFSNNNSEEFITRNSNKIIIDPLKDKLNLKISKGADIYAVYIERNEDNSLNIAGEMNDEIEENTKYGFNIIFFNDKCVSRLNLEVKNGKMHAKEIGKQSIMNIEGVKLNIRGEKIILNIPENTIGYFSNVFINISTHIGHRMMDKTAWRMLDM
ncbi:PIG-L family deacetylase [Clostridium sporogenes]|uniref:LmbE family protein n=2 Tax=Clostridium TaxID=1485 RepID=A0A0D1AHP5_CLOBO|nr:MULTISPECIES: PIG-L family deacetylase [Clostridium]MBE6077194.1 PIG-L family deacetylase [Clostridium lundense]MDU2832237.1 PIG-L family deacetylase [Clostridium botulinum]KIS22669.1 hypothetical protein N495_03410 [Clostridium botulinum B2 450]MCW6092677.1 PIG-L family deacetylase [Clostridium sporogenes]MCW7998558.1 PIG-L family deacetylase [Clostridium sp. cpc1]